MLNKVKEFDLDTLRPKLFCNLIGRLGSYFQNLGLLWHPLEPMS